MNGRTKIYLSCVMLAAHCAGCVGFGSGSTQHYQTVESASYRDVEVAAAENQRAIEHLENNDSAKAEQALNRALIADVDYGPAHNNLGKLYYSQRKYYLAAWEFEYAVKLMPDRAEPLYNLGMVYEAAEKLDEAIEFYTAALSIEPNNPQCLGNLARALKRSDGDKDEIQRLLKDLVLYDERPKWVAWAREQIATAYRAPAVDTKSSDTNLPADEETPDEGGN